MSNPFEDLRQAVVVRPMNSPGPQGAAAPHMKIKYSADGVTWHNDPVETDKYLSFSTDNGITWSDAIYFNNLSETLELVEKARQWAENPENNEVEPGQYSALHHALQAKKSEITAEGYAIDAAGSATAAFGAAAPAWDSATIYNYNDVVSFDNGHTYRCIGINIVGEAHAPNINGIDNEAEWTRITVAPDGYFEVDENGDLMPMITPITSEIFMLDENGDIMYQEDIDLEPVPSDYDYSKIEFVNSIADLRNSQISSIKDYVYIVGYYGPGTPGGGIFYKDIESAEADNGGTIIIDDNGMRWKRANVHEKYYASWFGVSTDIDDNSPLIQNALNAIPSGSILIFGPGTYQCKQTIVIPDHPTDSTFVKSVVIQGSANINTRYYQNDMTRLRYAGQAASTLTPFIDFTGSTKNKWFIGAIRGIEFIGPGKTSNIVGLWLYFCIESIFDNVFVTSFQYGMQIDADYYYNEFNNLICTNCDYGFRANHIGNGSIFNYCTFHSCNIGYAGNLSYTGYDTGVCLKNCYFECNNTAIYYSIKSYLYIGQCFFEGNRDYNIYLYSPTLDRKALLVLENSWIYPSAINLTTNKAFIKQYIGSDKTISYIINNNYIYNLTSESLLNYLIYAFSGDVIIEARNNVMASLNNVYPICSTTPSQTSYFNNDFS